jgi:probable rRNA maturation factor
LALSNLGRKERDLHVTVVGDRQIRRLHGRYLGVRRATDVLAFNLEGPGPSRLLGEVVISADTAARQAARLGLTLALEMDLLLVHGVLHLVGYDDHDPREARLMHEREYQILSRSRRRPPPARLFTGLLGREVGTRPVGGRSPRGTRAQQPSPRPVRAAINGTPRP